ncbi:MAG: hypothetical protein AAB150_09260 [Pseudomonadota bacterium]
MRTFCVDWDDGALVAELLGPALAYHRALAVVSGGVNAGLMLSRALYLTRRQSRKQSGGWFCGTATLWTQEIGLTRREQETVRRDLGRLSIWEEAISGIAESKWVVTETGEERRALYLNADHLFLSLVRLADAKFKPRREASEART